jgi:hypothetical protein
LLFEPTDTPDIGRFICEDDEFFMFSIVAWIWLDAKIIFYADWPISFIFYSAFKYSSMIFFSWNAKNLSFYNICFGVFATEFLFSTPAHTLSAYWSSHAGFFNSAFELWILL